MPRAGEPAHFTPPSIGHDKVNANTWPIPGSSGLTIREHFAAMAMQAIAARPTGPGGNDGIQIEAELAVKYADALISALAKAPHHER